MDIQVSSYSAVLARLFATFTNLKRIREKLHNAKAMYMRVSTVGFHGEGPNHYGIRSYGQEVLKLNTALMIAELCVVRDIMRVILYEQASIPFEISNIVAGYV